MLDFVKCDANADDGRAAAASPCEKPATRRVFTAQHLPLLDSLIAVKEILTIFWVLHDLFCSLSKSVASPWMTAGVILAPTANARSLTFRARSDDSTMFPVRTR